MSPVVRGNKGHAWSLADGNVSRSLQPPFRYRMKPGRPTVTRLMRQLSDAEADVIRTRSATPEEYAARNSTYPDPCSPTASGDCTGGIR